MLDQQIKDLVSKSLPELAANTLKEFIEHAEDNREEIVLLKTKKKSLENEVEKLKEKELNAEYLENIKLDLKKREDVLFDKERNFEVSKLKHELLCEKKFGVEYKELMNTIFKNTVIKENITKNVSHPDANGGTTCGYGDSEDKTTTTE